MLGGSRIPGMLLPFLPVRAPQSQEIPNGFGHSPYGLWGNHLYWEPVHQKSFISIQASKAASHGAPLSLWLLSHVPFSHGTLILGPWLFWGLIIQFCLQCWDNLSLCRYTENSAFIFTCHYTTVLSEHATDKTLFFRAGTSCCFSCQITGDICWSDHPH